MSCVLETGIMEWQKYEKRKQIYVDNTVIEIFNSTVSKTFLFLKNKKFFWFMEKYFFKFPKNSFASDFFAEADTKKYSYASGKPLATAEINFERWFDQFIMFLEILKNRKFTKYLQRSQNMW